MRFIQSRLFFRKINNKQTQSRLFSMGFDKHLIICWRTDIQLHLLEVKSILVLGIFSYFLSIYKRFVINILSAGYLLLGKYVHKTDRALLFVQTDQHFIFIQLSSPGEQLYANYLSTFLLGISEVEWLSLEFLLRGKIYLCMIIMFFPPNFVWWSCRAQQEITLVPFNNHIN